MPLELREQWLDIVEELMGRGVRTRHQMAKLLSVPHMTAHQWMMAVQKNWHSGLTDEQVNWRRESLYSEVDQVAKAAWVTLSEGDVQAKDKANLFKVIILANQRKASLTGLENLEIKIKKEITMASTVDIVARVEKEHSLPPGALAEIGKQAARQLNSGRVGRVQITEDMEDNAVRLVQEARDVDDIEETEAKIIDVTPIQEENTEGIEEKTEGTEEKTGETK